MAKARDERPVAAAAQALATYLALAAPLLALADEDGQHILGAAAHSAPPWNASVANAMLDPHAGIRALERGLRAARELPGLPQQRGGSDGNTYRALEAVVTHAEALGGQDAEQVTRQLDRWANLTRRLAAVDDLMRWIPIRASEGCLPPRCPWCKTFSLRCAPQAGLVSCFKPSCTDDDGNRPVGRLDYNKLTAEPQIAWRDGSVS